MAIMLEDNEVVVTMFKNSKDETEYSVYTLFDVGISKRTLQEILEALSAEFKLDITKAKIVKD